MTIIRPVTSGPPQESGYASSWRAWYVVGLLILLYGFAFVDRFVIGLLVGPLSQDLGIGDADLGLLLGAGFAIAYSLAGLPIAGWVDRGPRRVIVVVGALIWSAMTILAAFAQDYLSFAAARIGLAIGEAALTPAAISLIADLFPREKRALPISLYVSVASVMVTGALVVGAGALDLAHALEEAVNLAPWRITLILCGLPGIVLGLLFLVTVKEPSRRELPARASAGDANASRPSLLGYLRRNASFYLPFYAAMGIAFTFVMGLAAWMPTVLVRGFQVSPSQAGYLLGAIGIPASLVGAFLWPYVVGRIAQSGRQGGAFICLIGALALGAPLFGLTPIMANVVLFGVLFALAKVALANTTIMPPVILQAHGPAPLRGRLIAVNLMALNLVGFSLGPFLVPQIAHLWPGDPAAIGHALALLGATAAPIAGALLYVSWLALGVARRGSAASKLQDNLVP